MAEVMHKVKCGAAKRVFKCIGVTVGVSFVFLLLFLGSLFFREQRLPRFVISRIENRLSSRDFRVRIDLVSFGFRHGLRLQGVRVYDLKRKANPEDPVGRAQVVTFDYWNRSLDVMGAEYRRLPDSYYHPELKEKEPPEEPEEWELPELPELKVRLEHPVILGATPDEVRLRLSVRRHRIDVKDIRLAMPDRDRKLAVEGDLSVDLSARKVTGRVSGHVGYSQIESVLETLDVGVALPYVEAFSEVTEPIPAAFSWDGDLASCALDLRIFLEVPRSRYRGVPIAKAKGGIFISVKGMGDDLRYAVTIDLQEALDRDGRSLAGRLTVGNADGPVRLRYDVKSDLRFDDLLSIVDVFDREDFALIGCDSPPQLSLKGTSATDDKDLDGNDLTGRVFLRHGSVLGLQVNDMTSDFTFRRDVFESRSEATGKNGGKFSWHDRTYLQGFDMEKAHFSVVGSCRKGSLAELADLLDFDLGERHGTVDADVALDGMIGKNLFPTLNGKGSVRITDGKLAQMKLFAGLTEILAETVPGVSYLVNQSQASADFEIKDGVFKSENIVIEGGLISIAGRGAHDLVKDALDFVVRVRLFKKDTLVGRIVHPLTSPLVWMLMEFKLTGPLDKPSWRRITLKDRLF